MPKHVNFAFKKDMQNWNMRYLKDVIKMSYVPILYVAWIVIKFAVLFSRITIFRIIILSKILNNNKS